MKRIKEANSRDSQVQSFSSRNAIYYMSQIKGMDYQSIATELGLKVKDVKKLLGNRESIFNKSYRGDYTTWGRSPD